MIIYGSGLSPFVRKILALAAEKSIGFEHVPVGLGSADEGFLAASPFRKIPALADEEFSISDSSAIAAYLDAKHPEPNMIPTEARARARTIWFDEYADTIVVGAAGPIFFNRIVAPKFLKQAGDEAAAAKAEADLLPPALTYLESVIPESGYLVEDRITLADIAVASPFVNLSHCGIEIDANRWPKAAAYVAGILGRPSYAPLVQAEKKLFGR
jgi:glutathione S-transferase